MAKLFEITYPYRLKVQEIAMNVKIEYLVIIALVVLFIGFLLMNQSKLSASENFIAASDADVGQENPIL